MEPEAGAAVRAHGTVLDEHHVVHVPELVAVGGDDLGAEQLTQQHGQPPGSCR